MPKCDHISFDYRYSKKFRRPENDYGYVQLAKHTKKGHAGKILFILDYVPTEDLRSGRLLGGATGQLFDNAFHVAQKFYKAEHSLDDFAWLAVAFNAFKTAGTSEQYRADAKIEFEERIKHIITEYKPDRVVTFGLDPYRALNGELVTSKYSGKKGPQWQHLLGVPIDTTVKSGGTKHRFKHFPTLSLNPLVTATGKGEMMYLLGYVARNLENVLHGGLRYEIPELKYKIRMVDTIERFDEMLSDISSAKNVGIDTETKNLMRITNRMLTIQFAPSKDVAYILPIGHKDSPWLPDEFKYIKKKLRLYFEGRNKNKQHIYANAVFDLNRIRVELGVRFFANNLWDVFAGEFGIDENMKVLTGVMGGAYYSLLNICMQYGCRAYYESDFGKEKRVTIDQEDLEGPVLTYMALDVVTLHHIRRLQIKRAKVIKYDKYQSLVSEQISDMLHMFSCLEVNGSPTDIKWLFHLKSKESPIRQHMDAVIKTLGETKGVQKANAKLQKNTGAPTLGLLGRTNMKLFDIGKKAHLETLFFDTLKLKPLNVGKSGKGKLDKEFQKKYEDVPEVALYQELQKVKKIFNSYVKAFVKQWGSDSDMRSDSSIRPFFQFLRVVTGRTSATKPSLHQIPSRNSVSKYILDLFPSRGDLGKMIKRLFVAKKGRLIVKIDYAAHEVRGWSIITGDQEVAEQFYVGLKLRNKYKHSPSPELAEEIKFKGDVHKLNAAYFFSMPIETVDKPKRDSVKQVIFGLIYQQGMEGVAKSTGQTLVAIKDLVKRFFKRFPVGANWFDDIKKSAMDKLYVESPLGRRRNLWAFLIPKDAKGYDGVHAATGRRAVNSPIQGMGSDFLVAGARCIEKNRYQHYKETGHYPDFYPTNSVHDSLEFSVAYEDIWLAISMIEAGLTGDVQAEMEKRHGMRFTVPLEIDFEFGHTIKDCDGWDYSLFSEGKSKGSLCDLLRNALEGQNRDLEYGIDVEETLETIHKGFKHAPLWAKKQFKFWQSKGYSREEIFGLKSKTKKPLRKAA